MKKESNVTIPVKVMLPSLPNFIKTVNGESIAVNRLTEDALRQLGKEWTDALVQHARNYAEPDEKAKP